MVTKKVFQVLIANLEAYFLNNRKIEGIFKDAWFEGLSILTDEELLIAIKTWVKESSYMPNPRQLVEIIKGTKELQAEQQWQLVLRAAAEFNIHPVIYGFTARGEEITALLDRYTDDVVKLIGGFASIASISKDSYAANKLEEKFKRHYITLSRGQNLLPPPPKVYPDFKTLPEVATTPEAGEQPITKEQLRELQDRIKDIGG
jgi:hypothetical protein